MILAVDVGNTRVKVMVAGARRVVPLFTLRTAALLRDARELRRRLDARRSSFASVDGAAMCSVVPALDRRVAAALAGSARGPVMVVRHTTRFPFALRVAGPRRLGTDRLCAAAAVIDQRRSSAIVVDIGSAVTVDLVLNREFRGGLIMAGPGLSLWALASYAKRLPMVGFDTLGSSGLNRFDDTRPAMALGALTAARAAVVEGVRLLKRTCKCSPAVFVTGGGAAVLDPFLPTSWKRDPHLVGRGLLRLWALEAGSASR